jgi:hypothetical protein
MNYIYLLVLVACPGTDGGELRFRPTLPTKDATQDFKRARQAEVDPATEPAFTAEGACFCPVTGHGLVAAGKDLHFLINHATQSRSVDGRDRRSKSGRFFCAFGVGTILPRFRSPPAGAARRADIVSSRSSLSCDGMRLF